MHAESVATRPRMSWKTAPVSAKSAAECHVLSAHASAADAAEGARPIQSVATIMPCACFFCAASPAAARRIASS